MMHLPWVPISGSGSSTYQPIWAEDAAAATEALLSRDGSEQQRLELVGPELLSYEDIVRLAMEAANRPRPLIHLPLPLVKRGLRMLERLAGPSVFATWEEAELLEEPMTTARGPEDTRALGVEPKPMREVLGLAG
jgi:NADH dehydrogenase